MGTGRAELIKKSPMSSAETAWSIISNDGFYDVSLCIFCEKKDCQLRQKVHADKSFYKDCGYEYCGKDSKVESFLRGQDAIPQS